MLQVMLQDMSLEVVINIMDHLLLIRKDTMTKKQTDSKITFHNNYQACINKQVIKKSIMSIWTKMLGNMNLTMEVLKA